MTPKTRTWSFAVLGVLFLAICSGGVQASVVVQGTRLVYPADAREVTIKLNNTGSSPVLTQHWLDDGDANNEPEKIKVPFLLSPAVIRLEPQNATSLRIAYTGEKLPDDRESLFWLNVLETPSRKSVDDNVLQFAFRTRIKVFFRPQSLSVGVDQVGKQVSWQLMNGSRSGTGGSPGDHQSIKVTNPTAYYVSFSKVELVSGARRLSIDADMLEPFSTKLIALPVSMPGKYQKPSVHYEIINDYGGRRKFEKFLAL